jgi:hypothetical protein
VLSRQDTSALVSAMIGYTGFAIGFIFLGLAVWIPIFYDFQLLIPHPIISYSVELGFRMVITILFVVGYFALSD